MIVWLKQLVASFGISFLWIICLVYFIQGFRSLVWTAVSYQLKDRLNLSPSASQLVFSVAFFPWSIKPLYGILSDCIPINGRKRIPYLIISTILSLFPWLILGLKASMRSSSGPLMIFLTIQNLGSAMADVVVDAMIAEAVRSERAAFAGDLQSLSWFAMAFGGICGSLLGGFALANLRIETIFLLFSVLPAMQLLSCGMVEEDSTGVKVLPELGDSRSSHGEDRNGSISDSDVLSYRSSTTRRKRNRKDREKQKFITARSKALQKDASLAVQWFQSLKSAIYSLFHAFKQPMILRYVFEEMNALLSDETLRTIYQCLSAPLLMVVVVTVQWVYHLINLQCQARPMAWFFLAHVTLPNLSTVMFYYMTEVLHLDASFLGTSRVVGWIGLMLGTFIFNRFLKHMKLRKILMSAQVGLAVLGLFDIILVSRLNVSFGVSDKLMVLCGSALADAVNQFKFMPFLILSGQLCPPGIEGTLFALFMSINNLGTTLGSFVGAGLASMLSISSSSFDNLLLGILVQVICMFIPIGFLFLIPKEATGTTA